MERVNKKVTVHLDEKQTITELSQIVQRYDSEIILKKDVQGSWYEVNLKSFLGLINLRLQNGDTLLVECVGQDAEAAFKEIEDFFSE
ncbi:HPr family phosphocarrier protein [Halobacillus fulvus]|nr:HPr family phosphocarrier protein [Halobacillus fulvus]